MLILFNFYTRFRSQRDTVLGAQTVNNSYLHTPISLPLPEVFGSFWNVILLCPSCQGAYPIYEELEEDGIPETASLSRR